MVKKLSCRQNLNQQKNKNGLIISNLGGNNLEEPFIKNSNICYFNFSSLFVTVQNHSCKWKFNVSDIEK